MPQINVCICWNPTQGFCETVARSPAVPPFPRQAGLDPPLARAVGDSVARWECDPGEQVTRALALTLSAQWSCV